MNNPFDTLSNELIIAVAEFVSAAAADLQRFSSVDRRTRWILCRPEIVQRMVLLRDDLAFDGYNNNNNNNNEEEEELLEEEITTYQDLGFVEVVSKTRLIVSKDNRIHYDFVSMDVEPESMPDIDEIRRILLKFPNATVELNGHCGIGAPRDIAPRFSLARSLSVLDEICDYDTTTTTTTICSNNVEEILASRIVPQGWGKSITYLIAVDDDHPFGPLARVGRGWCEIYFRLKGLCLPRLPSYYYNHRQRLLTVNDTSKTERIRYMNQVYREVFEDDSEGEEEEEFDEGYDEEYVEFLVSDAHELSAMAGEDSDSGSGSDSMAEEEIHEL